MIRTFVEHCKRSVISLDGIWEFVTADEWAGEGLPETYPRRIAVPMAWETMPGLENYRGRAWYRTTFESQDASLAARLVFGGVSHTATVYVDGRQAGTHYDAFTPWEIILEPLAEGEHELIVEVDNSFGEHSALHLHNDYFTYGGMTRPVELQHLSTLHIDKIFATPVRTGSEWRLDLRVRLRNCGRDAQTAAVSAFFAADEIPLEEVTVPPQETLEISAALPGLDVEPWSPQQPRLYTLAMILRQDGQAIDDKIDRIGFRQIDVDGDKLLLNGEVIRPQGFNRHEDHPQFGCALPVSAMVHDLMLIRDLNADFVRTCHYPNDQRFLDLCDELGFFVWEESHARAVAFEHPRFREQIAVNTQEMVEWHFNHPSIIIWGCLNECDSVSESGASEHARVLSMLKVLDGSRPVTFASNKQEQDLCLGLVDIVSWNIYSGWYNGRTEAVEPRIEELIAWLDSAASKGGAGKPIIMSEFGGGAIYGNRQRCRSKWSEEYQADVLDETLRVYTKHPRLTGTAIWQYCDVRITEEVQRWAQRPRTMNNKGVVDEYRRPKLAYDTVKARFGESLRG